MDLWNQPLAIDVDAKLLTDIMSDIMKTDLDQHEAPTKPGGHTPVYAYPGITRHL